MDTADTRGTEARDEPSWLGIEEASPLFTGKKTTTTKAGADVRRWSSAVNATLIALIMTMPPLLLLLSGGLSAPTVSIKSTVSSIGSRRVAEPKKDVLLGGLLVPGFDEQTCASRYQGAYYHKPMTWPPSPHLLKRLREQEALQRRCGPGTEPYTRASERLRSGQTDAAGDVDAAGCSLLDL